MYNLLKIELLNNEAYMSMIKSNYTLDANDLHPISTLIMDTNNNNIGKMHHNGVGHSLTPILVSTNMSSVQNANTNVISNGWFQNLFIFSPDFLVFF